MEKAPSLKNLNNEQGSEKIKVDYDQRILEYKEKLVMSFLRTTALSPQNFILQKVAALEIYAQASLEGYDPQTVFRQFDQQEQDIIYQRLEKARDRLHSAHHVQEKPNKAGGKSIFAEVFAAGTLNASLAMQHMLELTGCSYQNIIDISRWVQDYFFRSDHQEIFTDFKKIIVSKETKKEGDIILRNFVEQTRDALRSSDLGEKLIDEIGNRQFENVLDTLLPDDFEIG